MMKVWNLDSSSTNMVPGESSKCAGFLADTPPQPLPPPGGSPVRLASAADRGIPLS
jgi:hypothetical protein